MKMRNAVWCFLIFFLLLALTGCEKDSEISQGFEITYLSVGQADAAVISCDGHYAMIDCGSENIRDGFTSYKVDTYLQQEGINEFDYIFCSHYDEDHYAGFAEVLKSREVKKVYGPSGINEIDSVMIDDFKNVLSEKHKKIKTPDVGNIYNLGKARITVLAVDSDPKSKNDSSLVLMVTYKNANFLFMGDAETKTEQAIFINSDVIDFKCDVLKIAHHGSSSSSSSTFLEKACPSYAILTVSPYNYLPEGIVLERLEAVGCTVYRTDEKGNITCRSDGDTVMIYDTNGNLIN